jgi:hypothetical protein
MKDKERSPDPCGREDPHDLTVPVLKFFWQTHEAFRKKYG